MKGAGRINFSLVGTYTSAFITTPQPGASYDCAGFYGAICGAPQPKWRHTFKATWETPYSGLDVSLAWRYLGKVDLDASSSNPILQLLGVNGVAATDAHFSSRSYLDMTASMQVGEKVTLRLGINNLLDKDPPINGSTNCPTGQCNGNTWPQVYDALGRYIFMSATAKF